jgi:4-diphosphocytidyl-2-C-methyl-D-erythritol kinase
MQAIGVTDTITFAPRSGPFALAVHGPGIPGDQSNLVWRAAEGLWRAAGRTGAPRDVHVKLEKAIPVAAGLGGGSANAAAALLGLNAVWELRVPRRELLRLAAELGADVPYFLQGGTALGVGRGDEVYPVDDIARFGVIVIKPSFGVATADAYRWLDEDRAEGVESRPFWETREVDVDWPGGPLRWLMTSNPLARRHPASTR